MGYRKMFYIDPRRVTDLKKLISFTTSFPYNYAGDYTGGVRQGRCDHCLCYNDVSILASPDPPYKKVLLCFNCLSETNRIRREMIQQGEISLSVGN